MLFYTGTTLAAAMYVVGAVEIVLVFKETKSEEKHYRTIIFHHFRRIWHHGLQYLAILPKMLK